MIHSRISHVTTVITIRNWSEYQNSGQQNGQQKDNNLDTNKNDKNEKKSVVTDNGELGNLLNQIRSNVEQSKFPCNIDKIQLRLEKPFLEYGTERIKDAFNKAFSNWKNNGHTEGDIVRYALKILREDYAPIQRRTH